MAWLAVVCWVMRAIVAVIWLVGAAFLLALGYAVKAIALTYGFVAMWIAVGVIALVALPLAYLIDRRQSRDRQE